MKYKELKENLKHDWNLFVEHKLPGKRILYWIGMFILGAFLAGVILLILLVAILSIGLPNVRDLDKLTVAQSTTIYDREGNVLYVKHGDENRQYVKLEDVSSYLINATISIEDDQFWTHSGFDVISIVRAGMSDVFHLGARQGGSTITQQYIKSAFLSSEKSITRKIKELILSVELEHTYDKKTILELYLNKIPYGNSAYGIEKAAQIYFNKHAKDLDLAESAVLASIPNAPSRYNPFGDLEYSRLNKQFTASDLSWRHINSVNDLSPNEYAQGLLGKDAQIDATHSIYLPGRSDVVLKKMEDLKYITHDQRIAAVNELSTLKFNDYHEKMTAPHFVFYILDQLEKKYGKDLVENGGLKVYTTLDPKLEGYAEQAVSDGAASNEKKFNAKNAALVAMDPKTGEVLAMVGSRNYWEKDTLDGAVNVALQYEKPGSSFKPFVYSELFLNGYAPSTVVFDAPITWAKGDPPKDFDGKFWGPMTIRRALGQSRNIPAIKAYFLAGEQEPIKELAEKMGIVFDPKTRDADDGWPLALGAKVVRLFDMVDAFGAFATGGIHHDPISILKVENADGQVLEQNDPNDGVQALDPQVAYLINSILSDTSVRLSQYLTVPGQINAAKSGTSNEPLGPDKKYYPQDLWTMGYTTNLVAGVWTGNNRLGTDHISVAADGVNVAAPIWKNFMTQALKGQPSSPFPVPQGIKQLQVVKTSGKLPGPNTPPEAIKTDVFASFGIPTEVDDSFTSAQIDTRNQKLANEYCPTEFVKNVYYETLHDIADRFDWEQQAQLWLQSQNGQDINVQDGTTTQETQSTQADQFLQPLSTIMFGQPPTVYSELCTPDKLSNKPTIEITSPASDTTVKEGDNLDVKVNASAPQGIDKVEYYLDDIYQYFSNAEPYTGTIRVPKGSTNTSHTITAKVIDKFGYSSTQEVQINATAN